MIQNSKSSVVSKVGPKGLESSLQKGARITGSYVLQITKIYFVVMRGNIRYDVDYYFKNKVF